MSKQETIKQENGKPDGYTLLCAGLGKKQKEAIKHLLEGKHIYVMQDLSRMSQIQHITDENKDDYYEITEPIIRSLTKRNLLTIKKVYSTVQPDTEHYEMRLKSGMVELARMACT